MTAVDLDALDKLRGAATAGPWDVRWQCPEEAHHHDWDEGWIADPEGATVAVVAERYTSATEDAALIVAAVNALGDLIADARRYRALREAVEDALRESSRPEAGSPTGRMVINRQHIVAALAAVDGAL